MGPASSRTWPSPCPGKDFRWWTAITRRATLRLTARPGTWRSNRRWQGSCGCGPATEQRLRRSYHADASNRPGSPCLCFGGRGKSIYRQVEVTARVRWLKDQEMVFSYVRSTTRGNLNEFSRYLGDFHRPIIPRDLFSQRPEDLPNRFLTWGVFFATVEAQGVTP